MYNINDPNAMFPPLTLEILSFSLQIWLYCTGIISNGLIVWFITHDFFIKNWSSEFWENLVTFHKLLQPTIAVGYDGGPSGGQTMECHKQNDESSNLQATTVPTRERRE
jgi:hypothetical protein